MAKKIAMRKPVLPPKGLKTEGQLFTKVLREAEKANPKKRSVRLR